MPPPEKTRVLASRSAGVTVPELEQSKAAVLSTLASAHSRRSYKHAIEKFIDWYCSERRLVACRREFVTADAAGRVGILPPNRSGICRVGVDISAKLSRQVGDGREDAACNDVTLNFGEPEFNLVEPRGIRWGEVKAYARIVLQKLPHVRGLVSREIVEDDMDLLSRRAQRNDLLEKGYEVLTGVARGGFSMNTAGGGIQRRIQGERSVPVVFEPMAFNAAGGKRQNRVEPIKCLNRRLFINTEHGGMLRWVQIQSDNVGGFSLEVWIIACHIPIQPMRLQPSFFPNAMDGILADAQLRGEFAATPLSGTIPRLSARSRQNPGSQLRGQHRGWLSRMAGIQSVQPRSKKTLLPSDDGRRRSSQSLLDRAERRSLSQHQNQPGSEYISRRQRSGLSNATQFQLLLSVKDQRINGHTRLDVSRVCNVYSATAH